MNTAFLFPGQGAQVVGMGCGFVGAYPAAAEVFSRANRLLGYDLQKICFEGPAEQLNSTTISQPAIFTASAAILEVLRTEQGTNSLKPDVTAGLSLGEYTALYAAGVINFNDCLRLVQKRGEAMQAAAEKTDGSMVSIIGLDEQKVRNLCEQAAQGELLEPVNFNCPGQIAVSGSRDACKRAEQIAVGLGAIKAVPLAVAGAFHTNMMDSAADSLSIALEKCRINDPAEIKIVANVNAEYYNSSEQIRQGLIKQLTSPILWQKCMEKLIADGIEKFYEIGPGRVLTGLMKRIDRKIKVINVSTLQNLQELLQTMSV
jgi:[acyl-carrier-protein] S-malonyltransferase